MRIVLLTIAFFLALFLCGKTYAEDFNRYSGYYNRINLYHYVGGNRTRYRSEPFNLSDSFSSVVQGGGISGPFRNPNPEARKPENLTACIYDVTDTLVYERENKVCPYKYVDQNQNRVERRRQEWLKTQAR